MRVEVYECQPSHIHSPLSSETCHTCKATGRPLVTSNLFRMKRKSQSREWGAHPYHPQPFPSPAHLLWDSYIPHSRKAHYRKASSRPVSSLNRGEGSLHFRTGPQLMECHNEPRLPWSLMCLKENTSMEPEKTALTRLSASAN